ncbi:lipopolysaccharide biosynthesis protein [Clostridium sp.]|uniref:lipopolysaccharide biosynthesis protein n=1 Tax=Clostridium sp. TaxID=1506 RepID=UPI003463D82B
MRTGKAIKNVKYNIIFYVILSMLTFITKKVFIDRLGDDMNGLNALFSSILSLMNLAELGIGSAVMFALYKPVNENNKPLINGILNLYKKMYSIAGVIMLTCGVIFIPFLGIFVKGDIALDLVRICYLIYLLNTSFSYFFSHKLTLLYVHQQGYVISKYDGMAKVLKNIVQILILFLTPSYIYFLCVETIFNILYYYFINRTINNCFKDILSTKGVVEDKVKESIYSNIKALSLHKMGSFVVFGTDYMLMAFFTNLDSVGNYSNYMFVITFFTTLVMKFFDGIIASIGNLISSSNEDKTYNVFNKIFFFNFWLVCFVTISIYNTIDHFIYVFFGSGKLLNKYVIIFMMISFFITNMRPSIEKFKEAAGIYRQDRFAPILEALINLVASLILGHYFGIAGIILGTIISSVAIVFWLRPVLVYRIVFKRNSMDYFIKYFKGIAITLIILLSSNFLGEALHFAMNGTGFLLKCIFNVLYINLFLVIIYRKSDEFIYFKELITTKLGSVFSKLKTS